MQNTRERTQIVDKLGAKDAQGWLEEKISAARAALWEEFAEELVAYGAASEGGIERLQGWLYKALLKAAEDPEDQVPDWLSL